MAEIIYDAASRCWIFQMEASTYCIGLSEDASSLQHIYWGPRIAAEEALEMAHAQGPLTVPFESPTGLSREEYAPWGEMRFSEPSLKVEYADGTRGIEWVFEEQGTERSGASQTLWLRFRDRAYSLTVALYYRLYDGHDVVERWVRLENVGGSGPITIEQALSADWRPPRRERYRLTYLYGQHMKETQVAQVVLGPGKVVLESRRGATSHQFNPWVALDSEVSATREDVREWMFTTLDTLLSEHNIEFVKWDMNRFISEPGWPDEADRNPERVWLDHVRNLYWIIDELRRRHPHVAYESCDGGGRVDLGIMLRVEQVWPSDNTDAFDRLRIQEGFSYAYVPRVMMCWVTDCPNFFTTRTVPLSYRFHVAMAGSLGIGGDLSQWTPQELEEAQGFIATYKRLRPVIQNGLLYRLRSPRAGRFAASQYVAQDGSEVVVFAWGHSQQFGETQGSLPLRGLEEDAHYADTVSGVIYSGAYLAQKGLPVNLVGDFDSRMVHLVRTTSAR